MVDYYKICGNAFAGLKYRFMDLDFKVINLFLILL